MNRKVLIYIALFILIIDCALFTYKIYQKEKHHPKPIHKVKNHAKYSVYLTSDDGPLKGSKNLNEIIETYEVPMSLFLVGKPLSSDEDLEPNFISYKNNSYALLGNHSFSHANSRYKRYYKNPENVENDFIKNKEFLELNSKVARLPGRNVWVVGDRTKGEPNALKAAKLLAKDYNYSFYGWDYELRHKGNKVTLDAKSHYKKIKELLKNQKTFTKNHIVILMHDQMFTNPTSQKVLGELILLLQDDEEIKLKKIDKYPLTSIASTTKN